MITCERVAVESGNLNIYGVADRIEATAFPINIQRVHIVAKLLGKPKAQHAVTWSVNDGTATRSIGSQMTVELNENGMTIAEVTIQNVHVPGPVVYTPNVVADGRIIGHALLPMNRQVQ